VPSALILASSAPVPVIAALAAAAVILAGVALYQRRSVGKPPAGQGADGPGGQQAVGGSPPFSFGRAAQAGPPGAGLPGQVPPPAGPPAAAAYGPGPVGTFPAQAGPPGSPAAGTFPAQAPPVTPPPPPAAIPAGWYADPSGAFSLRYWDGSGWTGHVTAADGSQAFDPPPA
jgi:hypothetical protein